MPASSYRFQTKSQHLGPYFLPSRVHLHGGMSQAYSSEMIRISYEHTGDGKFMLLGAYHNLSWHI